METNTTGEEEYDDYTTYPEYQAGILIWKVVPPILILLGTIGNILSIVVLTRKSIKASTTALYLTFLAASDLCVLYTGLLRQWIIHLFEYDVRHLGEAVCKIHLWLVYTSLDFSAWILIAVTLERVISAWCPYSAKTKCSRKYATALLIAILLFLFALNSHMLYGMVNKGSVDEHDTGTQKCSEIDENYGDFFNLVWPWIDLCVFCLIPFTVIVVGNCCILFRVIKSQRKTKARIVPSVNTNQRSTPQRGGGKHSSMTAMLFTLNMVFLFTTSPVSIYNIGYTHWVESGTNQDYATLDLWWAIVNMLQYTNNSINFLLYCLSGTRFRQEVKRIFCPKPRHGSSIPLDNYTRTKFNTQVPTQTPAATPDRDVTGRTALKVSSSTLQIPNGNQKHSPDTSGFVSSYSLHPGTAANPGNSTSNISFTTLSAGPVISSAETSAMTNSITVSAENIAETIPFIDNGTNSSSENINESNQLADHEETAFTQTTQNESPKTSSHRNNTCNETTIVNVLPIEPNDECANYNMNEIISESDGTTEFPAPPDIVNTYTDCNNLESITEDKTTQISTIEPEENNTDLHITEVKEEDNSPRDLEIESLLNSNSENISEGPQTTLIHVLPQDQNEETTIQPSEDGLNSDDGRHLNGFVSVEKTNIDTINSAHEKVSPKADFDKLTYDLYIRTIGGNGDSDTKLETVSSV